MWWTYLIIGVVIGLVLLLCFALAVASFSFDNYYEKWKALNQKRNSYGLTTLDYVEDINEKFFDGRIKIKRCAEFEDHYSTGTIGLSAQTMGSNSLASFAIVSHELGHARQDFTGDKLKKHWRMRKTGKICGLFFLPLLIVGLVLTSLWAFSVLPSMIYLIIGLACAGASFIIFLFAVILKYEEIKIEKEASDFAIEFLKEYLLDIEIKYCQELLKSARLTYWAGLIRTLLSWTMLTSKTPMFR